MSCPCSSAERVHVDCRCVGFGQFGQPEIVGGEEAEGFVLQQVFGDGVREGEAVKSRSTAVRLRP